MIKNIAIPAKEPSDPAYVFSQLRLANEYRNARVAIRRELNDKYEQLFRLHDEEFYRVAERLHVVCTQIEEMYERFRQRNLRRGRRCEATTDERYQLEQLKDERRRLQTQQWEFVVRLRRPVWNEISAARKRIVSRYQAEEDELAALEGRPRVKKKLKDNDDWRREFQLTDAFSRALADAEWEFAQTNNALNREYSEKGLNFGTRGLIDRSLKPKQGTPPATNFKRYRGDGSLYIPLNTTWGELKAGEVSCFRLTKRGRKTFVRLRFQLKPVERSVTVQVHLDEDMVETWSDEAKVSAVQLVCRRVGTTMHYKLQLQMDVPATYTPAAIGVAGFDLGWRYLEGVGLRTAVVTGVDHTGVGHQFQAVLPESQLDRCRHAKRIGAERALEFDRIKQGVRELHQAPEAVLAAVQPRCRSQARLVVALREWGDYPDWLERWRNWDKRKYNEQFHLLRKFQNYRKDYYRKFVREVAMCFHTIYVEDISIAALHKRAEPGTADKPPSRENRNYSAIGELREMLQRTLGDRCVKFDASRTSQRCNICGVSTSAGASLTHVCSFCQNSIDRDALASTSLALAAARNASAGDPAEYLRALDPFRHSSYIQIWKPKEHRK